MEMCNGFAGAHVMNYLWDLSKKRKVRLRTSRFLSRVILVAESTRLFRQADTLAGDDCRNLELTAQSHYIAAQRRNTVIGSPFQLG